MSSFSYYVCLAVLSGIVSDKKGPMPSSAFLQSVHSFLSPFETIGLGTAHSAPRPVREP